MVVDNNIIERGGGRWRITTYSPPGIPANEIIGRLRVSKEYHLFYKKNETNNEITIAEISNPNIAGCYNLDEINENEINKKYFNG